VDRESYLKMLAYTGCDAVMVGRGAMGQPFIFGDLLGNEIDKNPLHYIKKHIELLKKYYPDRFIVKHMRKHILWYLKNIRNANKLKAEIVTELSLEEVLKKLEEIFDKK
jgi:tRNA-dihydrouridine synthase